MEEVAQKIDRFHNDRTDLIHLYIDRIELQKDAARERQKGTCHQKFRFSEAANKSVLLNLVSVRYQST